MIAMHTDKVKSLKMEFKLIFKIFYIKALIGIVEMYLSCCSSGVDSQS